MKAWLVALLKRMTFIEWTIVAAAVLFALGVALQAAGGSANCGRAIPLVIDYSTGTDFSTLGQFCPGRWSFIPVEQSYRCECAK